MKTVTDTAGGRKLIQIGVIKDGKFVPMANVNFFKDIPVFKETE